MKEAKILIAESPGFPAEACNLLEQSAEVVLADLDRAGLMQALGDADVLWVRLRNRIDAAVLDAAPRLQVVATPTTGLTHIDVEEAGRRGIKVVSLRGETEFLSAVRATAEHTVALILALLRRLPESAAHVRNGGWNRDLFQGGELYGKTVGVVGYGRLGRIVARYLLAFECKVLAADPFVAVANTEPGVTLVPLDALLRASDIVTVHVNLNEETRQMFGRGEFRAVKRGALFINTARGELVNEAALVAALDSGRLGGAALDVLAGETSAGMANHPLVAFARTHSNVLITPHIGGCTAESMQKTETFLARKLHEELRRRPCAATARS
jgi:D-3-phosphoglycerate dehydrogenase